MPTVLKTRHMEKAVDETQRLFEMGVLLRVRNHNHPAPKRSLPGRRGGAVECARADLDGSRVQAALLDCLAPRSAGTGPDLAKVAGIGTPDSAVALNRTLIVLARTGSAAAWRVADLRCGREAGIPLPS